MIPYAPNGDVDRPRQWDELNTDLSTPAGLLARSTAQTASAQGIESMTLSYVGLSRAEARAIEAFCEARMGRDGGFWCPTFQHDFYVTTHTLNGINLRDWGYATNILNLYTLNADNSHNYWARHFFAWYAGTWMLARFNGTTHTGATDSAGFTIVGFDYAAGAGEIAGSDVVSVTTRNSANGLTMGRNCFVRLADDAVTTEWTHPHHASIALTVVPVPHETP